MYRSPSSMPCSGEPVVSGGCHAGSRIRGQPEQHGEVAQRVRRRSTTRCPNCRDHRRRDAGPEDAREVEAAGVERDRVAKILAPDELDHQRLPRRDLDALIAPFDGGEHEQPANRDRGR